MVEQVIIFLAPRIRQLLSHLPPETRTRMEEIRLRCGRPIILRYGQREASLDRAGRTVPVERGFQVEGEDIDRTLQIISQGSIYALEEELRGGYLTLPGGHRVGMVGQTVVEGGRVKTLKNVSAMNIRICREISGAADQLMPFLVETGKRRVYHTLLVSPPQGGKTTLLRDIVRQLSDGVQRLGFPGVNVGLVDERSEVAGCYGGVPQLDVGKRTDVLDRCPKAEGMVMLLRSMSPEVVAADEIGRREDAAAVDDLLNAGIALVTTVHGRSMSDIRQRPVIQGLVERKVFERLVVLGRSRGPGTIEAVLDSSGNRIGPGEGKRCTS
ncbi:MAG: stage III sporulation protein AA [Firmicutes bacterium]|nr:stage III sporulation protein AA [Bacillota bacterium]